MKRANGFAVWGVVFAAGLVGTSAQAKQEDWYWGFTLGWAKPTYSGALQTQADALAAMSGVSRFGWSGGLGFYWPTGPQTIMGVATANVVDHFSQGDTSLSINQTLLGYSVMHSFGPENGLGWYLRGDAGLAFANASAQTSSGSSTTTTTSSSDTGFGFLGGAGYGIGLSDETRLLIQADYSYRKAGDYNYSSFAIRVGPLF
jgi:hypothetical protein